MSLFARKDISSLQAEVGSDQSLKRALGAVNLVTLGIGAIIGAGIFVLTGQAAANYAGPAIVYSFILAGTACALAGLCYAEFSAMIPIAGSAYTYSYATLGEFVAWIIGWDLILEYLFAASTVAVGWSGYVVSFLKDVGINIPPQYTSAPYTHSVQTDAGLNVWRLFTEGWSSTGAVLNVPAMVIVALITILLIIGISESASFNNVIVVIKLTVVFLFIGFGLAYINRENWEPFVPPAAGPGKYGWDGILRGAGVIFFAYIGFDAVSTAAQETRNPQRDMPIGILGSLAICTVLYIAVALVLTGIVKYTELNVPDPIAVGINAAGPGLAWLRPIVKIGAIAGLSSVILVMLLGQPRIFYTMAKDGLLPPIFSKVHPALPHAVRGEPAHRRRGDDLRRAAPDRAAGRAGVDRDAARVRHRVCRRAGAAVHRPRPAAPVPYAPGARSAGARHPGVLLSDVRAAGGHLGAAGHLDGARAGDLFRLWAEAFEGAGGAVGRAGGQAGRRAGGQASGRAGERGEWAALRLE